MPLVAVVDTNVWVSAFLNPKGYLARLIAIGRTGSFVIVSSRPLMDELREVLLRPRIMNIRQTTAREVETFVVGVRAVVQWVPAAGDIDLCRDPDDNVILETAIQGEAMYVVSRDEDVTRDPELATRLLERGIEAITVQRFLNLLGAGSEETDSDD